ncbi:MAG: hypothetical protein IPJ65_04630 [Archangiaceae bacterium]|nr:hypothetical protein [Archangiaceae bacterium]
MTGSRAAPWLQFVRVALARHRRTAVACALVMIAAAVATRWVRPPIYRAGAELCVLEPTTVHRLANPFAAVPSQTQAVYGLSEELTSRDRLVAYVKGTGLIDQWFLNRPAPLKLKDQLLALVRGPMPEKDVLEGLVATLEKKLQVTVDGDHVFVAVEWNTADGAYNLVRAVVAAIHEHRETHEVEALEQAATSLEEQLAGVRAEMKSGVETIVLEYARARAEHRLAQIEGHEQQFLRDQTRAAELLVRSEEKRISAQVMRRTNAMRFVMLRKPSLPRVPVEADGWLALTLLALGAAGAGLAGALTLAFASGRVLSGAQLEYHLGVKVYGALRGGDVELADSARRLPPGLAVALPLAAVTGICWAVWPPAPFFTLLPLIAAAGLWAVWKLPLKWPLLVLLVLAVTLDDPSDRPYVHLWSSPLYEPGHFFFTNVAWFTGFELCLLALAALMLVRRVLTAKTRWPIDPVGYGGPRVLRLALFLSAATVLGLIVLGIARGGNFREALWQFRSLLFMPLTATLALYAFDFPSDLKLVVRVLAFGSVVKTLLGAYFMLAIAKPRGLDPAHTTGHNDTMIFVMAASVALLLVWERPRWKHVAVALVWLAMVFVAMVFNDRRIAYVDLAFVALVVFSISPRHAAKRFVIRAAVVMTPVMLLYGAAGWNSRGGSLFKPVAKVRSIIAPAEETEEESSNIERDIENFNILRSWQRHMFIGQGFGSAFDQVLPSNDFSQSNFGHIGHNSVLWLMWIGGTLGFTGVLLYLAVAAFALGRTLKVTTDWRERVALLSAVAIFVTYLMQAFGDMGMLSIQFVFFVSVGVAIVGRLSVRKGVMRAAAIAPSRNLFGAEGTAAAPPSAV